MKLRSAALPRLLWVLLLVGFVLTSSHCDPTPTPDPGDVGPPDVVPPTPMVAWPEDAQLTTTSVGPTHLLLTWSPATNVEDARVARYRILRGNEHIYREVQGTTFLVARLKPGSPYSFAVEARASGPEAIWVAGPSLDAATTPAYAPSAVSP